ncbi:cupin domain-containing protein [Marivibrio halodurans]|uniref:Cupin domain-containing protein n=1 Tax=Marivibrio halodurans TaxID=2039722 RepID=A0A8J7S1L8_9PROT|nr:cupin domain-containing protein [Marivibrio halodurans]MBP5858605.1 cupin domain-containing protein [Marivibrio halodurans]
MVRFNEKHLVDEAVAWEAVGDGVARKILTFNEAVMMLRNRFEAGGVGPPHTHPHVQCSYVVSGVFDIMIDGETRRMGPGDSFLIPSGLPHGAICVEAGELIEVFSPMREDFFA